MRTGKSSVWMSVMVLVVGAIGFLGSAQAGWVDNFDQPTFDARWGIDIPAPPRATITLDTANDWAHFAATGNTDMWTVRNFAPILWTASPAGDFRMDTHVMTSTSQDRTVSGLTVYGDGVGSDDGEKPNFSLGLDHWSSSNRLGKLQGLGTNNPAIAEPATGGEAWLRLQLNRGAGVGGVDRYTTLFKAQASGPWHTLASLDRNVANARVGLFMKTAGGGRTSDFSVASLEEISSPSAVPLTKQWDFETGTLEGWTVVPGSTFDPQPTNSTRTFFNRSGNWHLGSTETSAGGFNDSFTGIIESPTFTLDSDAVIEMLVGGGIHPWAGTPDNPAPGSTAVNLERLVGGTWEALFTVTGVNNNAMREITWDLSEYAGDTVRIRLYDMATGGWGNICLDNVRVHGIPEPTTLALLGLGGLALLRRRKKQ
ncbi:PEP-CTERM sorting domain-containing protein [Planctomycetota bacterium]